MSKDYLNKLTQLITAAFGLAAGLAWNSAIQDLIAIFLPKQTNSIIGKFVYAIVLTLVAVWVTKSLAGIKTKT